MKCSVSLTEVIEQRTTLEMPAVTRVRSSVEGRPYDQVPQEVQHPPENRPDENARSLATHCERDLTTWKIDCKHVLHSVRQMAERIAQQSRTRGTYARP